MLQPEAIQARRGGFTRRRFIKGVIAAGATASAAGYLFRDSGVLAPILTAQGAVERLITLTVNGRQRRVDVPRYETLAMTLRYRLGLTGTKLGCDRAECGAAKSPRSGGWSGTAGCTPCSRRSWTRAGSSVPSVHRASQ